MLIFPRDRKRLSSDNTLSHFLVKPVCRSLYHLTIIAKLIQGFESPRIGVTREYCKVTEGLLWKGKALSANKQNLAREFCVVAGEFSDLHCLVNTLLISFINELSLTNLIRFGDCI